MPDDTLLLDRPTARTGGDRPVLMLYCQHSLGIGHLTRSFALARALAARFRVVFLNGGRMPDGLPVPEGIERIDLPPLGMDDGHQVVSRAADQALDWAWARRRELIEAAVRQWRPGLLLVELFPFGRKKFAGEILAMIRAARRASAGRVRVACSLRDILVDARPDQQRHDDRARALCERYFDQVLVHADPAFVRLEDSFRPSRPMRVPVRYTGFVVPERAPAAEVPRGEHLLVSAGGGIVGEALFRQVLAARARQRHPLPLRMIAGPFLPEAAWTALQRETRALPDVTLVRQVPDMVHEMRRARASVSQCGYNTALDLVVSGVPALVVPYRTATENEQQQRARRLATLGALLCADPDDGADRFAQRLDELARFQPSGAALSLEGAADSARWLHADWHEANVAEPRA